MKTITVAAFYQRQALTTLAGADIATQGAVRWMVILLTVFAFGNRPAMAEAPAKKQGYEAFRMMRTRNIFDPNRQPNVPSAPRAVRVATAVADVVALTGIMVEAEKTLAFFSGSRPEFNKVLPVKGEIYGATIVAISEASIEVERSGKRFTVAVGQTVPADGALPSAAPASTSSTSASASSGFDSNSTKPSSSSPTAASPKQEALLRRMMERRQQELK